VGFSELVLVRHAESVGNVAREQAERDRADVIEIEWRDADVPLSAHGRAQADAVGAWLADLRVDRVVSSPYLRARDTLQRAFAAGGRPSELTVDERLRDRELGVLDRLTSWGLAARYPDEAARKRDLGKLFYRPPGGESWADIALRVRSFLRDLDDGDAGSTVLVGSHDAVIFVFRYVIEGLDETELLDLATHTAVPNASVSRFVRDPDGPWQVAEFGSVDHLHDQGIEPTLHGTAVDEHRS
jgi:glucosyl-3-phosphoglycerate phosphatase